MFPQCNDLVKRSNTKKYIPHMTIANFKKKEELTKIRDQLRKVWKPVEFTLSELYFLSRTGG